jgi:putative transposase
VLISKEIGVLARHSLMNEYTRYYHADRTHLGLDKETRAGREAATGTTANAKVVCVPKLGGLHHRYDLAA